MKIPTTILQLMTKALAEVRGDANHQLSPHRRRLIYDAFRTSPEPAIGKFALAYLEILTARHILPLWQEDKLFYPWRDLPQPAQLIRTCEDRLRGLLSSFFSPDAEKLAAEVVMLTGEDERSPCYPTWCVFEAAVSLFFRADFNPDEETTDHDLRENPAAKKDVAHLALLAYAGRILSPISDREKLKAIWEHWYYETEQDTPLPWTLSLDPEACLDFWAWWLDEAIPRAWQLAEYYQSTPVKESDMIHLENGILFIGDIDEIIHEDDEQIVILCGPGDSHEETLTGEDARRLSEWLDRDYDALLQYRQATGQEVAERKRPRYQRNPDTSDSTPSEDIDIPF
ncbi:MAG: hypothetical protein JNM70_06810 [Anaerolineae bacterium]|nr:hypothetical protein [Anaerolineae bacterium]